MSHQNNHHDRLFHCQFCFRMNDTDDDYIHNDNVGTTNGSGLICKSSSNLVNFRSNGSTTACASCDETDDASKDDDTCAVAANGDRRSTIPRTEKGDRRSIIARRSCDATDDESEDDATGPGCAANGDR